MNGVAREILDFWFADTAGDPDKAQARNGFWYGPSEDTDREIKSRFLVTAMAAQAGDCGDWLDDPESALALVILLDQFPRNIWRGTAHAFSCDEAALAAARAAIDAGYLERLTPVQCSFLLMPFQHSESIETQRESVRLYERAAGSCDAAWRASVEINKAYAQKHLDIIERFGRFPHRNALVGRESTPEEAAWLSAGGETFGQDTG